MIQYADVKNYWAQTLNNFSVHDKTTTVTLEHVRRKRVS
jgi:hypothetical protein